MQSLTRCCRELILPLRDRYSGKTPQMPTQGEAFATVPAPRWQLAQVSLLPTLFGSR